MAGHSKWAQIKRKKAVTDARRGKLWTKLLKEVTVAARIGGGDPAGNPRLRVAIQDAKASNVPNENIDRAIKRGTGDLDGVTYDEINYEGYGPGGCALLIEAMTDNRNRTVAEIRHLLSKHGGSLGEAGSVAWLFDKRGYVAVETAAVDEETLMEIALEHDADDIISNDDVHEIYTSAESYADFKEALEGAAISIAASELGMVPQTFVEPDEDDLERTLRLIEALEDHDDVQNVWSNLSAELAAAVG